MSVLGQTRSDQPRPAKRRKIEYDTGIIDSKTVQQNFTNFATVMSSLKKQFFKDWTNPWITITNENKKCLQAMKNINLVIIEENKARLTQACDYYKLQPESFAEQITQKQTLITNIKELIRGTTVEEMKNLELGSGETFTKDYDTSTWWSEELLDYGDGTTVKTNTLDICTIADVNNTHMEKHFENETVSGGANYAEDLIWTLLGDIIPDNTEDNDQWNSFMDELFNIGELMTFKDAVFYIEDTADAYNINVIPENDRTYEKYEEFKKNIDAFQILEWINEINFVYHPWVTIEEIQDKRRYTTSLQNSRVRLLQLRF